MGTKEDIISEIRGNHEALQHEAAARHGWSLYDLTCSTIGCGNTISRHLIQLSGHRDAKVEDEWRYLTCSKCGGRGTFRGVQTPGPTPNEVSIGREYALKSENEKRKSQVVELKSKIAEYQSKIEALESLISEQEKLVHA